MGNGQTTAVQQTEHGGRTGGVSVANTVDRLKRLWSAATDAEREAFVEWLRREYLRARQAKRADEQQQSTFAEDASQPQGGGQP